jgi:hypothetical protein
MRRLILVSVLVLLAATAYRTVGLPTTERASPTLAGPAPNVGDEASTFVHELYDGSGTFDLSERGIYVLTFWDTLNQDSNQARPYFARLAEDFEGSGVSFAAVYIGDPPEDAEPASYAVLKDADGKLAALYNVKRVPRIFVISDGQVYLVHNNFLPENYEILRETLTGLVSPDGDTERVEG